MFRPFFTIFAKFFVELERWYMMFGPIFIVSLETQFSKFAGVDGVGGVGGVYGVYGVGAAAVGAARVRGQAAETARLAGSATASTATAPTPAQRPPPTLRVDSELRGGTGRS